MVTFFDLAKTNLYTGYYLGRPSATLLTDAGANITNTKRHGGFTIKYLDQIFNPTVSFMVRFQYLSIICLLHNYCRRSFYLLRVPLQEFNKVFSTGRSISCGPG